MRRKVTLLAATVAVALLAMACSPEERHTFDRINAFRAANGVHALQWDGQAYDKAAAWSRHMATQGRLSHSTLSDGMTGWRLLGENVASNSSLDGAIRALEASPAHRANLLNGRFTHVGVGAVKHNGVWWVTQVFVGR
jgi:uncharacterized protein YkwD